MRGTGHGNGLYVSKLIQHSPHEGHVSYDDRCSSCRCGFRSGVKEYFYQARELLEKHLDKYVYWRIKYSKARTNVDYGRTINGGMRPEPGMR